MDAQGQGLKPEGASLKALERHALGWRSVALSTAPVDRPAAEEALRRAYDAAGLVPPSRVAWVQSPLAGAFACLLADPGLERWDRRIPRALADADPAILGAARDALARAGEGPPGRNVTNDVAGRQMAEFLATVSVPTRYFWWHRASTVVAAAVQPELRSLRDALWQAVGTATRFAAPAPCFGHHDCQRLAVADFWTDCLKFRGRGPIDALVALARAASWFWPMAGLAIMAGRPSVLSFDAAGRLHSGSGPAAGYPDGLGVWAWEGVRVPRRLIEAPASLTVREIEAEPNTEVRPLTI